MKKTLSTKNIYTQFPTQIRSPFVIMIPTKVKTVMKKYLPKNILDEIHGGKATTENRAIAVELCLLFLSQLSSTYRNIINGEEHEGWKFCFQFK